MEIWGEIRKVKLAFQGLWGSATLLWLLLPCHSGLRLFNISYLYHKNNLYHKNTFTLISCVISLIAPILCYFMFHFFSEQGINWCFENEWWGYSYGIHSWWVSVAVSWRLVIYIRIGAASYAGRTTWISIVMLSEWMDEWMDIMYGGYLSTKKVHLC